jgi:hypothetical protein
MPSPLSPVKKGARSRRVVSMPRSPGQHRTAPSRRNTATALILHDFRTGPPQHDLPHQQQRRGGTTAQRERRSSAGLWGRSRRRSARRAWSGTKCQAQCDPTRRPSTNRQPRMTTATSPYVGWLRGFSGISQGFRAGFPSALRAARILAPRDYVFDESGLAGQVSVRDFLRVHLSP